MPDPKVTDAGQFPTEEIIAAHLGTALPLWLALLEYIHVSHPELNEEWRYYNDGKSRLLNVTGKDKTVCWVSVYRKTFRTCCLRTRRDLTFPEALHFREDKRPSAQRTSVSLPSRVRFEVVSRKK